MIIYFVSFTGLGVQSSRNLTSIEGTSACDIRPNTAPLLRADPTTLILFARQPADKLSQC